MNGDEAVAGTPGGGHPPDYAASRGLPRRPGLAASTEPTAARGANRRDWVPPHEPAQLADGDLLRPSLICPGCPPRPPGRRLGTAPPGLAVGEPVILAVTVAHSRRRADADLELGRARAVRSRARRRHDAYATSSSTGASSWARASLTRDHRR